MSPPLPPLPPSGPPNSRNFSRRNATTPSPPSPERRWILASSRNFIVGSNENGGRLTPTPAQNAIGCGALFGGGRQRRNGDVHAVVCSTLELFLAIDQREYRVIAAKADVVPRLPLGAPLPQDDVAGEHGLTAVFLDAKPSASRVAAVARGAARFFVCHA